MRTTVPWKRSLLVLSVLLLVTALTVVPAAGGAVREAQANGVKNFTILHTNDEHAEQIPYDLAIDYPDSPTTGGFSRLARSIKDIKADKAAAGEPVLTLSAGDYSQGTLFSALETTAAPELVLLQQMGYDAVAMGNHEVELGPQYLAAEYNAARGNGVNLPILSSNIIFSGYPPDPASPDFALYGFYSPRDQHRTDLFIQPYTTRVLSNGLKVGLFSLLGVEAEQVAPGMAPLKFGNVPGDNQASLMNRINTAKATADTLRNVEGCDVVVCLSHMGTYEEKWLGALTRSIDVIIGGHSHDLNYPPIYMGYNKTIIVQAKAYTEYLGKLELQYDPGVTEGPRVTVRGATPIRMDRSVGTDPAVDATINNFMTVISTRLGFDCLSPWGETDMFGDGGFPLSDQPPMTETNLGDLITDLYLGTANALDPGNPSRFAIEANGVIRGGVVKGATGKFSFYDLFRSLPLGGSPYDPTTPGYPLVSFYLLGAEVQGVMPVLLDLDRNDFFLQTSGLEYVYDRGAGQGQKLKELLVDDGTGEMGPIQPGTLYKLVTNYYTGAFLAMFNLFPRDAAGNQHKPPAFPDPMKEFIIHTAPDVELKSWQALTYGVADFPDMDGDGLPNVPSTYYAPQGRSSALVTGFYFAEGTCRPDFDPYIAIQNPFDEAANVEITYMMGDGTRKTQVLVVPGLSRATVHPPDVLGRGNDAAHDFSAKVECTNGLEIIVERPMYFDYGAGRAGIGARAPASSIGVGKVERGSGDGGWTGGHDAIGATSPAPAFYFAEGTCRPGFEPYFTIQNPGDEKAHVVITYMKGDGTSVEQGLWVEAGSRSTVSAVSKLGTGDDAAHDFSAKVECINNQEIVVERPTYFNYKGKWTGGSDVVGLTTPTNIFYFAEGTCRPGFEPYLTIQNPGATEALVKITYMKGDGTTALEDLTVPPTSRSTVTVKDKLGEGDDEAHDFSAIVETRNNVPIVVERPMYFNYKGMWDGGHDIVGARSPALEFHFAEGTCRPGFDAYIAVSNPSAFDARVEIAYELGSGELKFQSVLVPAHSRRTVHPADLLGVADDAAHDFSTHVRSMDGLPIIAERPMYFDFVGWTGGSCVVGF